MAELNFDGIPITQGNSATPASVVSPIQPTGQGNSVAETPNVDPSIVALMHGLKQNEGGTDYNALGDKNAQGQFTAGGIGQWSNQVNGVPQPLQAGQVPANFAGDAKQFGLDPTDFSPENQNKVIYAVLAQDKANGLTPEQALSKWNSGDPNKYESASATGSGPVGSYDVASYVQKGMAAAQQYAQQNTSQAPQNASGTTQSAPPSIGGFLGNVVSSGANFAGNLVNAAIHPIQTVQGIGSMAAGGLQELGGQSNSNTAAFDNLKNYFAQRYGGVSNIESTAYKDPVGFLADISTVLGIGGGAVGVAGKGAELAGLGTRAAEATSAAEATEGSGLAGILGATSKGLKTGAVVTNPLTPVVSGASKILSSGIVQEGLGGLASQVDSMKPALMADIIKNPDNYTEEQIANTTRASVAEQVASDFNEKEAQLSETGNSYTPLRENPVPIQVAPDFLDNAFREGAGVDIKDGIISANSASTVRATADINKLQSVYNLYKGDFLNGTLDSNKFLNLRSDLAEKANFGNGLTKSLERAAAGIRSSLNDEYRSQVPNLESYDATYGPQIEEITKLRKGLFDKDGNLLDGAINKIATATNKGKDQQLARLEQISPGITGKVKTLRNIEQIQTLKENKIGTFPSSSLKAGGVIYGLATGDMRILGTALATMFIGEPDIAIPLLRQIGYNKELFGTITSNMAKFLNAGAVTQSIEAGTGNIQEQEPQQPQQGTDQNSSSPTTTGTPDTSQPKNIPSSLATLASSKNFDLQAALKAGYSEQDIQDFLNSQS